MKLRSLITRAQKSPGFLLLEVLLAITVISIGSSVIMRTYSNSIAAGIVSQQYVVAANLVEEKFWDILALEEISAAPTEGTFKAPYTDYSFSVHIEEQMPELESDDEFEEAAYTDSLSSNVQQTVEEEEPIYILYKIEVTVTWSYRGDEKALSQRTAVIRKQPEDEEGEFDDFSSGTEDL